MEHVEQATAAPGEKRELPPPGWRPIARCPYQYWVEVSGGALKGYQVALHRCTLKFGHDGDHQHDESEQARIVFPRTVCE